MHKPEFSHIVRAHEIGGVIRREMLEAGPDARAALAARFALLTLDVMTAALELRREAAGIRLTGQVHGAGHQACVLSGVAVPFLATDAIDLLLVEVLPDEDEMELSDADINVELLDGDEIDLGELAAQALALALDPYPRSADPAPESISGVISEEEARLASSPFAVLRKP
ncbi:DUF177 domain-containing protein [Sandarakinorhabdus sp.]|uniref:DUF177 domain-containing protein n=1 Tax=Sandarakinorhabdus sp. TaxID=1916663 RepID=UPI00286DFD42|nr:DUF177 domain-containing protein [Sandarakinorhabdus sp.]